MEKQTMPFQKIVFVCVHEREPGMGACCAARDSLALHAALKARIKEMGLGAKIRVSRSGCQDRCAKGPNIMVFPDNVWYSRVGPADLDAIVADLVEGMDKS